MQKLSKKRPFSKIKKLAVCLLVVFILGGCAAHKVHTVKIESEANQIIDVLGENGIRARKTETGEGERKTFEIWVDGDENELNLAIQLMEDHCLGQPEPPQIEGGTVITSLEVERAREQRRIKMNIESQLRQLPGVTCVNVNFVPPQDRSLAINPYASTASVLINYKTPSFPIGKDEIAGLVARSVPALKPEDVSVVLSPKPLRQLPDNRTAYNLTRLLSVVGIGLATIAIFVAVVFFLQRKRRLNGRSEIVEQFDNEFEDKNSGLLKKSYDFDEDDENDGVNFP